MQERTACFASVPRRPIAPAMVTAMATAALTSVAFLMGLATESVLHGTPAPGAVTVASSD